MRTTIIMLATLACAALPARAADRLTDHDVKALVEKIEQGREHFEDALDDTFKHTVVRTATSEVDVNRSLNDFEKAIEELKDHLKPEYSASSEAATVLRQATGLDATVRAQTGLKGASEWTQLGGDLKTLATAYGVEFPLRGATPARRIGDRELQEAAEKLGEIGDQVRKALDTDLNNDKSVDESTRKSLLTQAEDWSKAAKTLGERVNDEKPSSVEADHVMQGATALKAAIDGRQAPGAKSAWASTAVPLQTVMQAYGHRPPA